jgi:hypothetical protein
VYETWIGKYKKLDGDIEDITFDNECDNVKQIQFIEEDIFDEENGNSVV